MWWNRLGFHVQKGTRHLESCLSELLYTWACPKVPERFEAESLWGPTFKIQESAQERVRECERQRQRQTQRQRQRQRQPEPKVEPFRNPITQSSVLGRPVQQTSKATIGLKQRKQVGGSDPAVCVFDHAILQQVVECSPCQARAPQRISSTLHTCDW